MGGGFLGREVVGERELLEGAGAAGYGAFWRGWGVIGEGVLVEFVAEGGWWDFICFWSGCGFFL